MMRQGAGGIRDDHRGRVDAGFEGRKLLEHHLRSVTFQSDATENQ